MTAEFKKLIELEGLRKITIGLHRNQANNFWYRTTKLGKVLNLLTYLFILTTLFTFIRFGIVLGVLSIIFLAIYVLLTQKMAGLHVKSRLLQEEELFDAAYQAKSAIIRHNGKIISFPVDWRAVIRTKEL